MVAARATFTVLGAGGYIGSRLVTHLRDNGHACQSVRRGEPFPKALGHVIFCIGLTSDFRSRIFDTVEAHVNILTEYLKYLRYESFLYLSSARVYQRLNAEVAEESGDLLVNPNHTYDIYNISKLTGEALCLAQANPRVRVARLSNVFGPRDTSQNFLSAVANSCRNSGEVLLETSLQSSKDYIWIDDAVAALEAVVLHGVSRLFNVASGRNVSNAEIVEILLRLGFRAQTAAGAPTVAFPPISVDRLYQETGFRPSAVFEEKLASILCMRGKE